MIAKDLMPWMFVKRTATWTPYVKIRAEGSPRSAEAFLVKAARRPGRRPPRG
ncbi:MAG: hypothetical protein KGM24_03055 [Elusimicrobia bacterium]|nr:hypothetical protein [Elusimicrobiota bacterium]